MKISLYRKLTIVSAVAIAAGMAGLLPLSYFNYKQKAALAETVLIPVQAPAPTSAPTLVTGKPVRLQVPSLGFDLEVADGSYNERTGSWTLSNNKVHYALPTTQPNNESGNTLIYGHYRPEVFARLHKIAEGAEAIIITDNGYRFVYTLRSSETVDPADMSVFTYQGKPRLTLQTCTGVWMQNRHLFYFDLKDFDKL